MSRLTAAKRLWALQILWAVRRGTISRDNPDAQNAMSLLGPSAKEALDDSAPKRTRGTRDLMGSGRRMSGSFESGRRR